MTVPHPAVPVPASSVPGRQARSVDVATEPAATAYAEVCGQGRVPVGSDDPVESYRIVGALARRTTERWIAALKNSDELRDRAAGLILDAKVSDGSTSQPMSETNRDELVQLASGSGDPAVYAMALWACRSFTEGPDAACGRLSIHQWAELDPDNAIPWLAIAGKARARGDAAAESAAFGKAARAHRSDGYNNDFLRSAVSGLPADAPVVDRSFLALEIIGVEAALTWPYNIVSRHCSDASLVDARVKLECTALAELFVTQSGTLIEPDIGVHLGARLGWSPQRVAALTVHHKALQQAIAQATPAGVEEQWTCRGAEIVDQWMHRRMQLGEAAAAEEALQRSGETEEAMAAKWDEAMETRRREASR